MNEPIGAALAMAAALGLLGAWTGTFQIRALRRLAARPHVPSDEYAFLRGRYRRRLMIAGVLVLAGGMIAGAYLSGMEKRADEIANRRDSQARADAGPRPEPEEADKQFVRVWGFYWIAVVGLVFVLVGLASVDAWASRRFWYAQLRELREEHQTKLRRDLAVYRTMKEGSRHGRYGGRLGEATEE